MKSHACIFALGWLVISLAVGQTDPSTRQADALFSAGKWSEALALYQPALESAKPGSERIRLLMQAGLCLQRTRRDEAAVDAFRQARTEPGIDAATVAETHLRAGYSLRMLQREREAIAELKPAAESGAASPNVRAEALLYTGWAHGQLREVDAAIEVFRRVETVPDVHGNYAATASVAIGRHEQERKRYDEAIAAYEKASTFAPVAATNLSRARIYRLECESLRQGDMPFFVKPFVTLAGGTGPVLQWVSQGASPDFSVSLSTDSGAVAVPDLETVALPEETGSRLHRVALRDLAAGQAYRYEITAAGKEHVAGSFRAPPDRGNRATFCVIGDTQSYSESLQPLLDAMGAERADFSLHVGDLVDLGTVWGEWKFGFFDPGRPYLEASVLCPAFGNHDGGAFYRAFFGGPEGLHYSFDWGDAHVVVIDSYGPGSGGEGRKKQLEWLERDLSANRQRWTIVSLHVPMIATPAGIQQFGQADFLPILEKHGVDLVFSGHHPHYRRYLPIGPAGGKPVLHITSGGGGGPVGGNMPSPILARGHDSNHYCVVSIEGDRLHMIAKAIDGEVIDEFELTKEAGRFAAPWMDESVDRGLAARIVSLYQELTTDQTHRLRLFRREGGLMLDPSRLPRGPFDPATLPDGTRLKIESTPRSPWKVPRQTFDPLAGPLLIRAEALQETKIENGRMTPNAELRLNVLVGGREFQSFTASADILDGP